jgi:PKD repeat protein
MTTIHTYSPATTTTYHVVLRIIAADNTEDTATRDITVTTSTPTPPSTAPTASFTANPTTELVPATITFDPAASKAAAGRTLTTYVWSFGDGSSNTETSAGTVDHTYYTAQASQNFTVTLTVIDDLGVTNSYSRTVTAKDWQPVAGFEQKKKADAWDGVKRVEEIKFYDVGTDVQTASFRSVAPTNWTTGTPKTEGTEPSNFEATPYSAGDKNLSYDPEGQSLGDGWGITTYLWSFDGGTPVGVNTTMNANTNGGCDPFDVEFQLTDQEQQRTFDITLTVVDVQGAQKTLTRKVTLYKSAEPS